MDFEDYREHLEQSLRTHLPDFTLILENFRPEPFHFDGNILLDSRKTIRLSCDFQWKWHQNPIFENFCTRFKIPDPFREVLQYILLHEIAHYKFCPGSPERGYRLFQIVRHTLLSHGLENQTQFLVNLISDLFVNSFLFRKIEKISSGCALDWIDQFWVANRRFPGLLFLKLGFPLKPFPIDYSLFIQTQLYLLNDPGLISFFEPFILQNTRLLDTSHQLAEIFSEPDIYKDKASWENLFSQTAEIFSTFFEPIANAKPETVFFPWYAPPSPLDAFGIQANYWFDPDTGCLYNANEINSKNLYDILDSYYRLETKRNLRIHPFQSSRRVEKLPSVHFPLIPLLSLTSEFEEIENPSAVMVAFDTSISMIDVDKKETILPWSSQSKYHHALFSFYRLLKWFENDKTIRWLNVMTFSDKTEFSGWFHPDEYKSYVPRLLFKPECRGTSIDILSLNQQIKECPSQICLFNILTDGNISNKARLVQAIQENEDRLIPTLFLFGEENTIPYLSSMMNEAGFFVHSKDDIQYLDDIIISKINSYRQR